MSRQKRFLSSTSLAVKIAIIFVVLLVVVFAVFRAGGFLKSQFDKYITTIFKSLFAEKISEVGSESASPKTEIPKQQNITEQNSTPTNKPKEISLESLTPSSFSDLFSGTGWIDEEKTTLYHDLMATAFSFRPVTEWVRQESIMSYEEKNKDSECIKQNCLSVNGAALFLNGAKVELPAEIREGEIDGIYVKILGEKWAVGIISYKNEKYEGRVYLFDGLSFSNVSQSSEPLFYSEYRGELGFGGSEKKWLAVYGGYSGAGYLFYEGNHIFY